MSHYPDNSVHPTHTTQPGASGQQVQWMAKSQGPVGCPPGLEYLAQVDQVLVHQIKELLEIVTGWETENKFRIMNTMGQQCYYAFEESDTCTRLCCGANRDFVMHIVDNAGQEVIRVIRPMTWAFGPWCACCNACKEKLQIEAPPGQIIGYVSSECYFCTPSFTIFDEAQDPIFWLTGPCSWCQGCGTDDFKVYPFDANGNREEEEGTQPVASISKQWSGLVQEMFTDADNFGVTFPMDMDVRKKATLLGTLFLIDFMYYEGNHNNSSGSHY